MLPAVTAAAAACPAVDAGTGAVSPAPAPGANWSGCDLTGANLTGAMQNWESHWLMTELLRRDAGDSVPRRKLAGLAAVSTDWCWDEFLALDDPERDWALDVLAGYVVEGDDAPEFLRQRRGVGL